MARPRKLPKVLTTGEQERLLNRFNIRYPTPHRNRTMVLTMLDAGLRCGEVVALRPEHLDLRACRITVREGKGARDRVVHIPTRLRDALADWLGRRAEWLDDPDVCPWLFPTRDGGQVSTRQVRAFVKREVRRAQVAEADRVSPHTLRHTFASDLYRETGNLRLVQELLGHSDVSTTQVYTHLVNGEAEEAMQTFRGGSVPQGGVDALVAAMEGLEDPVGALREALARVGATSSSALLLTRASAKSTADREP